MMRKLLAAFLAALTVALTAVSARAGGEAGSVEQEIQRLKERLDALEKRAGTAFDVQWRDGLLFQSADKMFRLTIGGRVFNDWAKFDADSDLESRFGADKFDSGVEFRSAQLAIAGTIYDTVEFKWEYDFTDRKGEATAIKDMYLGMRKVPVVGNIRIGRFYEPLGLETQNSERYLTFMERGLSARLTPSRSTGIMFHGPIMGEMVNYQVGAFKPSGDDGANKGGSFKYTGRLFASPWYEEQGRHVLHLGVSGSHRDLDKDYDKAQVEYKARPESNMAPDLVSTGKINGVDEVTLTAAEAALVHGPFSLQGEYVRSSLDRAAGSGLSFSAWYLYASYFLTGENRAYSRSTGTFGRIKPRDNFRSKDGGLGAWEVAARYSAIDLDDKDVRGGRLSDVTVGINWYLNPNTRVMANYVHADRKDVGNAHIGQLRLQFDF